jgi:hypothetical protein
LGLGSGVSSVSYAVSQVRLTLRPSSTDAELVLTPRCCLVCVLQVAHAADFYQRQEQYRQQRRSRLQARQQRLAQLQAAAAAAAAAASQEQEQQHVQQDDESAAAGAGASSSSTAQSAAWIAGPADAGVAPHGPALTTEHSTSSIASIDGQPLRVVVHSGGSGSDGAAAAGSDDVTGGSKGSGNLSSITTDEDTCGICFDNNNHVAVKYCGHRLCVDCYRQVWQLSGGDSTCPFCRARLEGYMYLDDPRYMDLE